MTSGTPQSFDLASGSRKPDKTGGLKETGIGSGWDQRTPAAPLALDLHASLRMLVASQESHPTPKSHNESAWEEGTIHGRLAQAQTSSSDDRDKIYCDRAAQAIRDFDIKF